MTTSDYYEQPPSLRQIYHVISLSVYAPSIRARYSGLLHLSPPPPPPPLPRPRFPQLRQEQRCDYEEVSPTDQPIPVPMSATARYFHQSVMGLNPPPPSQPSVLVDEWRGRRVRRPFTDTLDPGMRRDHETYNSSWSQHPPADLWEPNADLRSERSRSCSSSCASCGTPSSSHSSTSAFTRHSNASLQCFDHGDERLGEQTVPNLNPLGVPPNAPQYSQERPEYPAAVHHAAPSIVQALHTRSSPPIALVGQSRWYNPQYDARDVGERSESYGGSSGSHAGLPEGLHDPA
ncbi:hypothetical protein B0H19DRAFT_1243379 [Mycena capillaripes]|nr:hypothetical protein B0H19DRAFT_1243379 [Mycena capillaripes]